MIPRFRLFFVVLVFLKITEENDLVSSSECLLNYRLQFVIAVIGILRT